MVADEDLLPELPPELIAGVMRVGGKLLVSGASKAGKSFLLGQLALAVATGTTWLGKPCRQGRTLYLNLEIGAAQFMHRLFHIREALGVDAETSVQNLHVLNLRGQYTRIGDLVDDLAASVAPGTYALIIVDPSYKVQSGSENDADAITAFCGELDRMAETLGSSIAYCHHHSKGAQGARDARDRASGSGVYARDADAVIDMIELDRDGLEPETSGIRRLADAVPFRLEFVLRDFRTPDPVDVWYRYPLHEVDEAGMLADASPRMPGARKPGARRQTPPAAGQQRSARTPVTDFATERRRQLEAEIEAFMAGRDRVDRKEFLDQCATVSDPRTLTRYLADSERFQVVSGGRQAYIMRMGP